MFKAMKPETIERRAVERKEKIVATHASLIARLRAKAIEHGPESIWVEMLAQHGGGTP